MPETENGNGLKKGVEFPTEASEAVMDLTDSGMKVFTLAEMTVYLLLVASAGAVAIFWFMSKPVDAYSVNNVPSAWSTLSVQCRHEGGNWLIEHRECENIDVSWCDKRGGHFFSCESACRHDDPDGEELMCIMECVPVCRLNVAVSTLGPGPLNTEYVIDGENVVLERGRYEVPNPEDSKASVRYWVFEALTVGDLNRDGKEDSVVILVKEGGDGSTLYHVAVATQEDSRFLGSNAVLIGDRVAPQNNGIKDGIVTVNYADRYPWESFGDFPSVGKSKRLRLEGGNLVEISGPVLYEDIAVGLVTEKWGDCLSRDCDDIQTRILDGKDGIWYVEATYRGLKDDSVRDVRRVASVNFFEDGWKIGPEIMAQYICQSGRGQQEFASELCI